MANVSATSGDGLAMLTDPSFSGSFAALQLHQHQVLDWFIFFVALHSITDPLAVRFFGKHYTSANEAVRTRWHWYCTSQVAHFLLPTYGVACMFFDPGRPHMDRVFGYTEKSASLAALSLGFYLFDICLVVWRYEVFGPRSLFHAACAILSSLMALVSLEIVLRDAANASSIRDVCITPGLTLFATLRPLLLSVAGELVSSKELLATADIMFRMADRVDRRTVAAKVFSTLR